MHSPSNDVELTFEYCDDDRWIIRLHGKMIKNRSDSKFRFSTRERHDIFGWLTVTILCTDQTQSAAFQIWNSTISKIPIEYWFGYHERRIEHHHHEYIEPPDQGLQYIRNATSSRYEDAYFSSNANRDESCPATRDGRACETRTCG